ncbi:fibronectin type III domain-containing protein [Salana multivorans]
MVEAGTAAAGGLLVVGAVLGNGIASTVMDMSDGQTWLNGGEGSLVQVNAASGQAEYRLVIGEDGERLAIVQSEGYLVVTNLETGVITTIDLTTLLVSGSRSSDGRTETLVGGGLMVLASLDSGTIAVVDPLTLEPLSFPYRAEERLADAAIDREGSVWFLTEAGQLRKLVYSPEAREFSVAHERPVAAAGPSAVLVPHERGVTVFAPDGGAVLQVGARSDLAVAAPDLTGTVVAAEVSPADIVPASATDRGLVFIVNGRDLVQADVAILGCERPLQPAVFADRVYVPCGTLGRVIVLDQRGSRVPGEIVVPGGGDPELVVDDGRLIVHDPDDDRIVLVEEDGSTQVTNGNSADVPTLTPETPAPQPAIGPTTRPVTSPVPSAPPAPPALATPSEAPGSGAPSPGATDPGGTTPVDPGPGGPDDPAGPGGPDDPGGSADPTLAPSAVRALVVADDAIEVTWTAPETAPEGYLVRSSDGLAEQRVSASATSATLSGLACGSDIAITVLAEHAEGTTASAGTTVRTPDCVDPPRASELTPSAVVAERVDADVVVRWTAPSVEPTQYVVSGAGQSVEVRGSATSVSLRDVACGSTIRVTVTAVHAEAGTYSAVSPALSDPCPVAEEDLRPRSVSVAQSGTTDQFTVTWQAPVVEPESYRITGNGINRTAAAGATSASVTIACGGPVQLTVTAEHADGATGQARSQQLAHECAPPSPALTAPTAVQASLQGTNSIRVTWTAATSGAEEYVVHPSSGGTVSAGTATQAVVGSLAPGTYTFTVEARREGESATSGASNAVTIAPPAAVPAVVSPNASASHASASQVDVTVSWSPPADGGSPITGYEVNANGGGWQGVAGTSHSFSVSCGGQALCGSGGSIPVEVRAVNAVGTGPAGSTSASVGANPHLPRDGDGVLVGGSSVDTESGQVSVWIDYTPNAAWASFGGTCTVTVDGSPTVIPCGSSARVAQRGGHITAGASVSATLTASGGGVSATTSGYADVGGQAWCSREGICYDPVSDPGEHDIVITPAPWAPPQVPNPPVLAAGVGLILGAGVLRTRRRLLATATSAEATTTTATTPDDAPASHPTTPEPDQTEDPA